MQFARPIASATLVLACAFSLAAVFGVIFLPAMLPIGPEILRVAQDDGQSQELAFETPSSPASLLFIGDIMLARGVEWRIARNDISYPLSEVADYLSAPNLTIGNFEGTIRDLPNQELDGFSFDTTPAIAAMVRDAGVDIVSLSNNHTHDHGAATLVYTRETLLALGMTPFGDYLDSASHVAHATVNDFTFAFIGFHAFTEEPESIVAAIGAEKAAGNIVVVFPHWGNEYETQPSAAQTEAAHLFVDAGADLVIGAHPHVIQPLEIYRDVPIVYSLGNFLFDQDWSVLTQQGLTLGILVDETSFTMSFVPTSVIKSRVTIMDPNDAAAILLQHTLPATLKIARPTSQNAPAQQ